MYLPINNKTKSITTGVLCLNIEGLSKQPILERKKPNIRLSKPHGNSFSITYDHGRKGKNVTVDTKGIRCRVTSSFY